MGDSRELSRYRIDLQWKLSHVPSQPAVISSPQCMLSRDQRLPLDTWNLSEPQGNVFGKPRPMFDSSQRPCQGILHSTTPSAGKYRATCCKRWRTNWEHDYNSDVWEKAVNHEFFLASGNSTEYMAGQQRLQISELQFDNFSTPSSFMYWKDQIQNPRKFLSRISLGCYVMD